MTQQTLFDLPGEAPPAPTWSAAALAGELGLPPPTTEQAAVIEAPPEPTLVVAGAGSGKTETMAGRVVWLVANGHVIPDRVLGLTFTRKAAGELAERLRARLGTLRARGLLPAAPDGDAQEHRSGGTSADELAGEPAVSTYHAYAARVLAEHALRLGVEPGVRVLTEARAWQVADAVVRTYDGDMSAIELAPATVTDAVLELAGQLAEHLVSAGEVQRFTAELATRVGGLTGRRMYADVTRVLEVQQARLQLLPLVDEYARRKRAGGSVDYADQVALAADLARRFPAVGRGERERYRVVLLDEYQDTSHGQLVLLRALFGGGHPVTAVGDPCQSIYGWRGASAGNLTRFTEHFPTATGRPASRFPLSTSWRNDGRILLAANRLAGPLRGAGLDVPELRSRPGREASGAVRCLLAETAVDEARWVAAELAEAWHGSTGAGGRHPSVAVLARNRADFGRLEAALRAEGLPVEVVGLGGLLERPEIRDVVATLTVLVEPAAGGALMRLLTGPRWRIGPRDLEVLGRRAASLVRARSGAPDRGADELAADELVADEVDDRSIVDALDDLGDPSAYSPAGHARLSALQAELRALRARTGEPLPDLVAEVERTLGLDVEVCVHSPGEAVLARTHLDRFVDVASDFAETSDSPTLTAFLAYLAAAVETERGLEPGETEVRTDAVQLLTVHAAKGLEWDVVAVPGLCLGSFPSTQGAADRWTMRAKLLPFALRGDTADLPDWSLASAVEQVDARDALKEFTERWRERVLTEERRLAYVAVTRARSLVLCSGYRWGERTTTPREPAAFLTEIADACRADERAGEVAGWAEVPDDGATNPLLAEPASAPWPADPLYHSARVAMTEAAALVRRMADEPLTDADKVAGARWVTEADLLLAERARHARTDLVEVQMPANLSVSQLVALHADAAEMARSVRRPMPRPPAPLARRGTAFHTWLEARFGEGVLLDLDELPGAADTDAADDDELAELQAAFLASAWADRRPERIEVPFVMVVDGVLIRGRMDAVFADGSGGFEVVDWKTGRRPRGRLADAAAVQLATYRLAWASLAGVSPERVRAAFHYVRGNETVRPVDLLDADGLRRLVAGG